jgi:hypothetical protein
MRCGARRLFDEERCRMTGAYYYAPLSALYESTSTKRLTGGDR